MTVLIATLEGVWADRRVTGGNGSVFYPERKIVRGKGIVAAFCGRSSACTKACRAVKAGETDPQALSELADGLVVNSKGMYELSAKIAVRAPRRLAFLAHGSGYAEAQAFLKGRGDITSVDIRDALRYVSKVRVDCGDGIDTYMLAKGQ